MAKLLLPSLIKAWLPKREKNAYKGSCGRILILAGSQGMAGAGVLASWGAVKAGAGLVKLVTVKSQQSLVARRAPLEVTTAGLPEKTDGTLSPRAWKNLKGIIRQFRPDVIATGPGLHATSGVRDIILKLLRQTEDALVLDADALNVLRLEEIKQRSCGPVVITPHMGELAGLLKIDPKKISKEREASAVSAAKLGRCVCVFKGAGTLIASQTSVWKNPTGTEAMASGGMGDVLTGILAGLWGQFKEKNLETGLTAACLAVYLHGQTGETVYHKEGGLSVLASSVAEALPKTIKKIKKGVVQ